MKFVKVDGELAAIVPREALEDAAIAESDEFSIRAVDGKIEIARIPTPEDLSAAAATKTEERDEALAAIRAMRRPLPPGWTFDREELYKRDPDVSGDNADTLTQAEARQRALARMEDLAIALPEGWKFDREEANSARPALTAVFLDTNILVYAYSRDPKAALARSIMDQNFVIGVQTLNEFANASLRLGMDWPCRHVVIEDIASLAKTIVPTTIEDFRKGIHLADRHRLSVYNALMLAIALHAGCTTFYTEDMHSSLVIDDQLVLINPFV